MVSQCHGMFKVSDFFEPISLNVLILGLVLDEECHKKQKTREEPVIQIVYNVGKDDQMIVDIDHRGW